MLSGYLDIDTFEIGLYTFLTTARDKHGKSDIIAKHVHNYIYDKTANFYTGKFCDFWGTAMQRGCSKESMYLTPWVRETWKNIFFSKNPSKSFLRLIETKGMGNQWGGGRLPRESEHPLCHRKIQVEIFDERRAGYR